MKINIENDYGLFFIDDQLDSLNDQKNKTVNLKQNLVNNMCNILISEEFDKEKLSAGLGCSNGSCSAL